MRNRDGEVGYLPPLPKLRLAHADPLPLRRRSSSTAWDDPSSIMEVQNTRALAELEQALTETHTKPTGDPHVHDWPQTAALKLVKERSRGQPSELIEFSVSVKGGAQGASPPCNPIAVLLSSEEPWKVLGYTEWQQARQS